VIVSLSLSRVRDSGSVDWPPMAEPIRAVLEPHFELELRTAERLDSSLLGGGAAMLIANLTSASEPLSKREREALRAFVRDGGTAILNAFSMWSANRACNRDLVGWLGVRAQIGAPFGAREMRGVDWASTFSAFERPARLGALDGGREARGTTPHGAGGATAAAAAGGAAAAVGAGGAAAAAAADDAAASTQPAAQLAAAGGATDGSTAAASAPATALASAAPASSAPRQTQHTDEMRALLHGPFGRVVTWGNEGSTEYELDPHVLGAEPSAFRIFPQLHFINGAPAVGLGRVLLCSNFHWLVGEGAWQGGLLLGPGLSNGTLLQNLAAIACAPRLEGP
jgi:hypothetical protein